MSNNPNIDLNNVVIAGPIINYTVRQELDNGTIELQIRGVESEVKQYVESAKIRIEILPSDQFEERANKITEGYQRLDRPSEPKAPSLSAIDIEVRLLESNRPSVLYLNVDPLITPNTIHRYFLSSIDKVAAATESSSGSAKLQLYESSFKWEWRSTGQQVGITRDVIKDTEKRNNGEWLLEISSDDRHQSINYDLESIFNIVPYEVAIAGTRITDGNGGGI